FIDASSFEGCLDILDTAITEYSVNGRIQTRHGNRHPAMAPHGVYRCLGEDRWCAIAVRTDSDWEAFCQAAGKPSWITDRRFSTLIDRLRNVCELDRLVEEWTQGQTAEDVMVKLQNTGVAASVVKNIKDLHQDPQLAYRGHFWQTDEAGMEKFTFEAPPARLSKTPARFRRRFPMLGEHNDYVYFDLLGLSSEEYAQLVEEKVIF
ncbi:MAG: CoA transferase, partial [Chloroflexi bacterium]|nr:CoA transferase [Chloroflexota bacterium]